jgi:hypothetical protein
MKKKPNNYWTKERLTAIAAQFQTRGEFRTHAPGPHTKCCRLGILDKVCAHMSRRRLKNGHWTKRSIKEFAKQFSRRSDFFFASNRAYNLARTNGWLDEICTHMPLCGSVVDLNRPAKLYYLKIEAGDKALYKIGITTRKISERFRGDLRKIKRLKVWTFKKAADALTIERNILKHCADFLYVGPPILTTKGNTELFTADILALDT